MTLYLNGEVVSKISPLDRGFLYGDGGFTTAKIVNQLMMFEEYHFARLQEISEKLALPIDFSWLKKHVFELLQQCDGSQVYILKMIVTRQSPERGYGFDGDLQLTNIYTQLMVSQASSQLISPHVLNVTILPQRVSYQMPILAGLKTLNRLEQVALTAQFKQVQQQRLQQTQPLRQQPPASSNLDVDVLEPLHDALIFDAKNHLVEALSSNIFVCFDDEGKTWYTPDLSHGAGIRGVVREYLLNNSVKNHQFLIKDISKYQLQEATAIFLCNAVRGIQAVGLLYDEKLTVQQLNTEMVMKLGLFQSLN